MPIYNIYLGEALLELVKLNSSPQKLLHPFDGS